VNISKALLCQLCNFKSNNLLDMVKHNKSLRHIQIEQIYCLQRRCESLESIELGEIYQLVDGELVFVMTLMMMMMITAMMIHNNDEGFEGLIFIFEV
jgi:hypothetical protein